MRSSLVRSRRMGSVVEAVGQTPLLRLRSVGREAPSVEVYVKLGFLLSALKPRIEHEINRFCDENFGPA